MHTQLLHIENFSDIKVYIYYVSVRLEEIQGQKRK